MYARSDEEPWVLYALEAYPYEMKNLANDPDSEGARKELEARLEAWMQKTGDSWNYDWSEKVEDKGRLYRHETFYTVEDYLDWAKAHPDVTN
jgi:hypothetical protein